ncbi:MAG: beta-ketoacyl-[acyl-carrier-protein] synthase family protein [Proteobacteria bacterium]|nr:beta-ketoacyl-[acyl-carrier-protein] synthase family protein [Pseudomonadota bacterium]
MNRRVVITGVGLVTPLGIGKTAFMEHLFSGGCGIRPISLFDTKGFASKAGAEVLGFTAKDFIRPASIRRMDRLSQMIAAAARMALDDAGLAIDEHNRDQVGVMLGTCFGGTDVAAQFGKVLFSEGPRRVNPILVPNTVMNAPAGHVAIELGVRGVNTTVNHHEVGAETALTYAAAQIMRGRVDAVLTGGGDILSEFFFNVLSHFRTLSPQNGEAEGLRPFDVRGNGTVVGEGAGIVCLESLEGALARGVTPYCEIVGWGLSSAPSLPIGWPTDPAGPCLAITRALAVADITPGDIDYICSSANGGPRLDRLEADALQQVFRMAGQGPRITALKGALGESLSSGGMRTAAMALSLRHQKAAPITGLHEPIADLNFVRVPETQGSIRYGLINGISSGGTFVAVIFKKIE